MHLYFITGACSLAVHIALREIEAPFELVAADGADFLAINPKGYVPALRLDDGQVLTETVAVLQYVADRNPSAQLAPSAGSMERYRLQEWLSFINSEVHKPFSPLFNPAAGAEVQVYARKNLIRRLDWLQVEVGSRAYLLGQSFTVADAYLFTVLGWAKDVGMDLDRWPQLAVYHANLATRPAIQAALKAEGLA
jgi:glutathione S-transferase